MRFLSLILAEQAAQDDDKLTHTVAKPTALARPLLTNDIQSELAPAIRVRTPFLFVRMAQDENIFEQKKEEQAMVDLEAFERATGEDIEAICDANYKEFISSIKELYKIRNEVALCLFLPSLLLTELGREYEGDRGQFELSCPAHWQASRVKGELSFLFLIFVLSLIARKAMELDTLRQTSTRIADTLDILNASIYVLSLYEKSVALIEQSEAESKVPPFLPPPFLFSLLMIRSLHPLKRICLRSHQRPLRNSTIPPIRYGQVIAR